MPQYFEERSDGNSNFPCGICNKDVNIDHKTIRCSICNYKIHIKCNKIDIATFEKNKSNCDPIFCLKCQEIIPFQKLLDQQFYMTSEKGITKDADTSNLSIFPNNSLKSFFN